MTDLETCKVECVSLFHIAVITSLEVERYRKGWVNRQSFLISRMCIRLRRRIVYLEDNNICRLLDVRFSRGISWHLSTRERFLPRWRAKNASAGSSRSTTNPKYGIWRYIRIYIYIRTGLCVRGHTRMIVHVILIGTWRRRSSPPHLPPSFPRHSEMSIHARLYPAKSLYVRNTSRAIVPMHLLVASHLVVASTRLPTRERSNSYIREALKTRRTALSLMRENRKT